jgi:calcineurin-like phosphoesterase family protein
MKILVVGDVHGCARELAQLLERIGPTSGDRVIMVGDLVARGPAPRGVLDIVREVGAKAVRGNHEDRLLRWRSLWQQKSKPRAGEDAIMKSRALARLAGRLRDQDWALLESLPLWLDPADGLRVVHAGLVPGVPIGEQKERHLLYMRSIDALGRPSERRDDGASWATRYDGPPHVVFGHNAQREPQICPAATGIDTGCVYGGRLTAFVLEEGSEIPPPPERHDVLVSVPAERAYYPID